jgi:hypothetical protein
LELLKIAFRRVEIAFRRDFAQQELRQRHRFVDFLRERFGYDPGVHGAQISPRASAFSVAAGRDPDSSF